MTIFWVFAKPGRVHGYQVTSDITLGGGSINVFVGITLKMNKYELSLTCETLVVWTETEEIFDNNLCFVH